jgi:FkbM family methyltransferase
MAWKEHMDRWLACRVTAGPASGLRIVRSARCAAFRTGCYERPVQELIEASLRTGDVFLDVGANVGFFTLLAARRVGAAGRVVAFEPVPANVGVLQRNLLVNRLRNVTVIPRAVAESAGVEDLWLTDCPGGGTLTSVGQRPADAQQELRVSTLSLDEWIDGNPGPVRLIKVDVEGAELPVLRGMAGLVRRHRPVLLIELDDPTRAGLDRKAGQVRQWLRSAGYRAESMPAAYASGDHQVMHLHAMPD